MIERGFGAVPPGSVGRAPLSRHDGLSTCHCAFCHLFPRGRSSWDPCVFYAALIAELLEVTALSPSSGERVDEF